MLKFGFGGKITPRRFDYNPRYYDEIKDDLESRLGKHDDSDLSGEHLKNRIKLGIRQKYNGDRTYRNKEVKKSNLRLLYVFIVLIFVSYIILKSDKITKLMEYLGA